MQGGSTLNSVQGLGEEVVQPMKVLPPTPPLQRSPIDSTRMPTFVAKSPQLIRSALIANPSSPKGSSDSPSPQKPIWFGDRRVSLDTGKNFLQPPFLENVAHRLPGEVHDKASGISGRGGETAAAGEGRGEWQSPMKPQTRAEPRATVEIGTERGSRLKELEEYREHIKGKSRFSELAKPPMPHTDGRGGDGSPTRARGPRSDFAGTPRRQLDLQQVLGGASTPKPFSPAGSNIAQWGDGVEAMRSGEASVPSTPGMLSLQHHSEEPRARSATIAGNQQPQQPPQQQQQQQQQRQESQQQTSGPPVEVAALFSHQHVSGGSSPGLPSVDNEGIETPDIADLRLHQDVGLDARDDQARMFGAPKFSSDEPAPSLPWTSGSGGLTGEALEMLIKERSKMGGVGKGKGVAESGHEREDKTVEQKVMRWDNNCEGWLHVGSAIKQLLECNSNSFDRCFASRTLSKICSRQHHCGALVCTPTMLSSVCSCLEDTCSSFTANERAVGSSTDSGDVAGGGASVDSGSGKDKDKNLSARRGSDDGGRGSRDREWWEATASSDIGLVQGLNQQCILHCAYILFCCSRTGPEESEMVGAMGGIPALLVTASLKGCSSRVLEMSVMGLSMLSQHPTCANSLRDLNAVPILAAICSHQLRRFRTLRQRPQVKDRRAESQYDKLLGVSLRVAVSTAAAVMLTAEDADQAARNIDLELLGHVTSALKSYLIKDGLIKSYGGKGDLRVDGDASEGSGQKGRSIMFLKALTAISGNVVARRHLRDSDLPSILTRVLLSPIHKEGSGMAFMVEGKICCGEALHALSARGTESQSLAACLGGMDEIGEPEGVAGENDKSPVALRLSRCIREVLVKGQAESARLREVYAKLEEVLVNGTNGDGSNSNVSFASPSPHQDSSRNGTDNLSRVGPDGFEQMSEGMTLSPTNRVPKPSAQTPQPGSLSGRSVTTSPASTMYAYV